MRSFLTFLNEAKHTFSDEEARDLGKSLSVNWNETDFSEFKKGLSVESEHDDGGKLDVVDSKKDLAKIVLAHLKEKPDYYTKLQSVEEEVPANSISAGNVAGLKEPIVFRKRPKTLRR